MDWKQRYSDKITTAAEAVKRIRPGNRVFIGSACGEPQALVRAMVEAGGGVADTEVIHVLTLGVAPYADPKYAASFRPNAFFIGTSMRKAVNEARADYTPVFLSQVPQLFVSRRIPIDVALITVTPPDEQGYCSLGVSVDICRSAAQSAKTVIAQVNDSMPRTLGESFIHINEIEALVPENEPLLEWPVNVVADETIRQIAAHISRLVPDGSTLQVGIGRVPDAVLALLTDKNDLGIHTEAITDAVMKLAKAGNITGKFKTLHPGKIVGSFAIGHKDLFSYVNNNPQIEMHPSEYTNNPLIISRNDRMIAINSALEVDLTGQVCADSIGRTFFSGMGGHADFMRGATLARDGKPIIAMPSTADAPEGIMSRIVPVLQEGAGVITTRGDSHYVVTEYGIAYLHGRTLRERAMSLISVAHPDFRSELLHAAKRRHIVYPDQIMPPATHPYPAQYEAKLKLRNGKEVLIRPIRPDDETMMKDMFYAFSSQTVYLRFHAALKCMPHNKMQVFCNIDYDHEMALVAVDGTAGTEEIIGVGRYMRDPGMQGAEFAFAVADDWQRQGLGTHLFNRLVEIGQSKGIHDFQAQVLPENSGMLKIFHRSSMNVKTQREGGVICVTLSGPPNTKPAAKSGPSAAGGG